MKKSSPLLNAVLVGVLAFVVAASVLPNLRGRAVRLRAKALRRDLDRSSTSEAGEPGDPRETPVAPPPRTPDPEPLVPR